MIQTQFSVTPVLGRPMPAFDLTGHRTHTYMQAEHVQTQTKSFKKMIE